MLLAAGADPFPVLWEDIADAIRRSSRPPQLAVLNVCDSSTGVPGIASAGVRAVIACHGAICEDVALSFSRTFYACLRGRPIRAAYDDAVAVLASQDRHHYELHGFTGHDLMVVW
jgi:hypothetical protein